MDSEDERFERNQRTDGLTWFSSIRDVFFFFFFLESSPSSYCAIIRATGSLPRSFVQEEGEQPEKPKAPEKKSSGGGWSNRDEAEEEPSVDDDAEDSDKVSTSKK